MAFGSLKVRTGAYAYIQYDFETCFNCATTPAQACLNKVFGFEQRVSGWTWTNSRITLNQLNSVEPKTFVYGQARGSLSVDWVVGNPWYNSFLFDRTSCATFPATCAGIETYTWEATSNAGTKDVESFAAEIGIDQCGVTDTVRILRGAIVNNIGLRSSIGEPIRATADIAYSSDNISTTVDATPASDIIGTGDSQYTPFTFAHGQLQWNCCVIAELQSFDISLNQNPELLYAHNCNHPVDSFRRVFEMTGSFNATHTCRILLDDLYAQINDNSQTLAACQAQIVLTIDNGLTTTNQRKITYTFTGIGIGDHSTGVEPVEPIFENITWQARSAQVVAVTDDLAEP